MEVEETLSIVIDAVSLCNSAAAVAGVPDPPHALQECIAFFSHAFTAASIKAFSPQSFCDSGVARAMMRQGLLFCSPTASMTDYVVAYAERHAAFIVTNEKYPEHVAMGYSESWLAFHCVPFMWQPGFAPCPLAMERMQVSHHHQTPPHCSPDLLLILILSRHSSVARLR